MVETRDNYLALYAAIFGKNMSVDKALKIMGVSTKNLIDKPETLKITAYRDAKQLGLTKQDLIDVAKECTAIKHVCTNLRQSLVYTHRLYQEAGLDIYKLVGKTRKTYLN